MAVAASSAAVPTAPASPDAIPRQSDRGTARHPELRALRWRVRGISRVDRDVFVGRADLRGSVVVGGRLAAGSVAADGSLEVRGPIAVSGSFRLRGTLNAAAELTGRELDLAGRLRLAAALRAEGSVRLGGDVETGAIRASTVLLRGAGTIAGPVDAGSVDLGFRADATVGAVRARSIRVRGPVPNPVRWALGQEATVRVDRIEADTAYLEGARVEFVRAPEIRLGPAAHLVAYEGRLVATHRTSRVGPESWSPPPSGLRR